MGYNPCTKSLLVLFQDCTSPAFYKVMWQGMTAMAGSIRGLNVEQSFGGNPFHVRGESFHIDNEWVSLQCSYVAGHNDEEIKVAAA